jgi:hypothetical protein
MQLAMVAHAPGDQGNSHSAGTAPLASGDVSAARAMAEPCDMAPLAAIDSAAGGLASWPAHAEPFPASVS